MSLYLCGVEGGSTSSETVILSSSGEQLSRYVGPNVNQWLLGLNESIERIITGIEHALKKANLPFDTHFAVIGLALSGVDSDENAKLIEKAFLAARPDLADHVHACNDTLGTLFAVTSKGGIILIAGTGSNCRLFNENFSYIGVGGYGHMLGDEGSAFWISHRVLKMYMDDDDGLVQCPYNTDLVKETIFKHFSLKNKVDILKPLYNFSKSEFSLLCVKLADLARSGDDLTKYVFHQAGYFLAAHVMAVLQKADPVWRSQSNGIKIICRGSVFKSWDLLKKGFEERITPDLNDCLGVKRLTLILLKSPAAAGAALLAMCVTMKSPIPRKHKQKIIAEFNT